MSALSRGVTAAVVFGACLLLSPAAAAQGRVAISTTVSQSEVEVGEVFQLDVVVTVAGGEEPDDVKLPDLSAFAVLRQQQGAATKTRRVQGRVQRTQEQHYTFLLRAERPGALTIGEARANVGADIAVAPAVVVRARGAALPGAGEIPAAAARFGKNVPQVFLDVRVEPSDVVVGEQVTAVTEVWTQMPLDSWPRLAGLKPPGFLCLPLDDPQRGTPTQRTVNGRVYSVYVITKDALFPLEAGALQIPPLELQVSPAGSFFNRGKDVTVKSVGVTVNVKALPPLPPALRSKDAAPSQNVGVFQLAASLSSTRTQVGQPVTLTIAASGEGNLDGLVLPLPTESDALRVFPPTRRVERRDVTTEQGVRVAGRVVVDVLLQPQRDGTLALPPLSLVHFDPRTGSWSTAQTPPLSVQVGTKTAAVNRSAPAARQLIQRGARPLNPRPRPAEPLPPVLPAGAAVFALCAVGAALARAAAAKSSGRAGLERAARQQRKAALDDAMARGDLQSAERAVRDAAARVGGAAVFSADTQQLAGLLRARAVDDALVTSLSTWLQSVEAARYAPSDGPRGERQTLLKEAARLAAAFEARADAGGGSP